MTFSRRKFIALGAGSLVATTRGSRRAQAAEPIRIGVALGLTGPYSGYAQAMRNGMQIGVSDINAKGGVLGRKVELIVRDSQAKVDLGVTLFRDLITRDGVDFLIGPDGGAMAVAVTNLAKQHKKVLINAIAGSPRLTGELFHPYFFTLVPTGIMQGRAFAEDVGKRFGKVAWIGADYESAHQAYIYFSERLAKVSPHARIVGQQWPRTGESDFGPYITGIMSAQPEVLVSYLTGADIVAFIKQAKPFGLFPAMTFTTVLFLDDLKAAGADCPDGIIGLTFAPAMSIDTPQMHAFLAAYKAAHGGDVPSDWAIRCYDAIQLLAAGATAANTVDSGAVVKAIEALKFTTLTGPVTFRALDHQATVPLLRGITASSPDVPYKILSNLEEIPASLVWPTEEEVSASRKT